MPNRAPRAVYALLVLYIAISLAYQIAGSVSLIVGYFDLRHQVREPAFGISYYDSLIDRASGIPQQRGLAAGDTVESINGVPFTGRAQMQAARWYAHPGDTLRLGIRKPDGTRTTVAIPLTGYALHLHPGETIFVMFLHIVMPLLCLLGGCWVALARPRDPNAWFILVLLSYPQAFIAVPSLNFWPGPWLVLRLAWHLTLEVIAPAALLWLGLLFPERSRIDVRLPWLKWLVLGIVSGTLVLELLSDYGAWYDTGFLPGRRLIDVIADGTLKWLALFCIVVYWVAIFAKLRTASTPDARRRLRVLCAGSVVGLGSILILWALLPRFGISPANIQWLGYVSAVLMLVFPLSLAYVVVVERAMDLPALIRVGTGYILARGTVFLIEVLVAAILLFRFVIPFLQAEHDYALTVIVPVVLFAVLLRLYFVKRGIGDRLREWLDRKFFREAYNAELILTELADRVRSITDPAALIQTVSNRISEVLHISRMAVLLRSGNVFRLQQVVGLDTGVGLVQVENIVLPENSPPIEHLARTSAPAVLYRNRPESWFIEANGNERHALDELRAEVLLPLAGRTRLMGVMVLGPKRSEEPYSPSDLRLLSSVGAQAGLGLEVNELAQSLAEEAARHQRIQREVEIAREVQQRLFPQRIPAIPGVDLAGHCRPALGVGGDYYDMIELENGELALAIGDVSGKGIAAALLMAGLRASLHGMMDGALLEPGRHDLARIVRKLNRLIYESSAVNRYATFFLAVYDPAARRLRYVNAGHNPPLLLRQREILRLEACGPVIGLLTEVEYEEHCIQLGPGDLFLGYTDGISEAMTADDEEWGEERMQAAAEAVRDLPAKEILNALFRSADDFTAGAPQYDDMTLLVLRLTVEQALPPAHLRRE
jgi:sigma-B regulation protein RsbU (phosphoserine phosphatase)